MNKALRVASRRGFDSDSDSDFYYNSHDEDSKDGTKGQQQEQEEIDEDCPWRSAVDPSSGKTYYYHIKTRETQWMKPIEMASREEKEALAAKEKRQKEFFAAMEANIMQSIAQGFKAPEKKSKLDTEFENKEVSGEPLPPIRAIGYPTGVQGGKQLSPSRSRMMRNPSRKELQRDLSRPNLVRTISSMDSNVLRDLIARVPSSRHVMGGMGSSSRQSSARSIGFGMDSSHRSAASARFAALSANRGLSAKKVGSAVGGGGSFRLSAANSTKNRKPPADDDDDLPPLTVVTTPDLRKRESSKHDPREDLTRTNSLTLDQLALQGGGGSSGMDSSHGLMDPSKFLDASMNSRLTMSNNSLHFDLDPNESSHSSGGAGYLNHLQGTRGGFGHGSFHSYESSEGSLGGLNSSGNGLSVSSNLLPVEEVMNESELSRKDAVLEGENEDEESADEPSLSLGRDSDFPDDTTQNWLDAIPHEGGARNGEEIVGYGADAKPFSDAGFTSFFDESMANFDLSEKETKALQKLALITEQMAKVTEGDEDDDESEESEDEDSDDIDLNTELDGEEEQKEFPLFLESEEEEEAVTESEEEQQFHVSPSFRTPITSSTTKTRGTAPMARPAQSKSPIHRAPPRRTLGPKNTRGISQAQRNLQIGDDDSDNSETGNSSGGINLAAATLAVDNARSHAGRRHSGGSGFSPKKGENGRPLMEKDHSESSLNSNSSIAMANAARRLSLFRLKNIDRSKLRSTTGGKGGLAKDIAATSPDLTPKKTTRTLSPMSRSSTDAISKKEEVGGRRDPGNRPNLVRRNTCGTLYVGTTMSAPDKDATIKCICGVYRAHIHQSEAEDQGAESPHYRIFNDLESQQRSGRRPDLRRNNSAPPVPSLDQITAFYRDVFQRAQMEYDCIIISLIYVERLIKTTKGALRPRACNWRSILFSCMVLASKVWDDLSMWNADFSQTCPNGVKFPLKRINELEVAILSALSYKVKVPASEYAKYYFLLRSMLIKSGLVDEDVDTTSPLDVEGAKRLQQVSTQFQSGMGATRRQMRKAKSMRTKNMMRSKSVGVSELKLAREKKVNLEHVVKM